MGLITDIHNPWRDEWMPARFRSAYFHVDTGSRESGRRIVMHEFPKKELPYAEDMGRRAREFSVQAYCISYPFDGSKSNANWTLHQRDYRIARDKLITELEKSGPGDLQLPTLRVQSVVVARYRMQERKQLGGYCEFEIQFQESGSKPFATVVSSAQAIVNAHQSMADAIAEATKNNPSMH